jgi:CobQ-like glutamine amidotransferase family enzyme
MWNVARTLKLAALYPEHLDLNGDHGNLLVLQKRLAWRGTSSEIVSVTQPTDLEVFDFLLLGHGSKDAWAEVLRIDPELISKIGLLTRDGKAVLAINSGYGHLVQELDSTNLKYGQHVSEFQLVDDVVGYVNSDLDLPAIQTFGNTVLTLFHGPVLAKNPELADMIIKQAGWCDVDLSSNELTTVSELARASRKAAFED